MISNKFQILFIIIQILGNRLFLYTLLTLNVNLRLSVHQVIMKLWIEIVEYVLNFSVNEFFFVQQIKTFKVSLMKTIPTITIKQKMDKIYKQYTYP